METLAGYYLLISSLAGLRAFIGAFNESQERSRSGKFWDGFGWGLMCFCFWPYLLVLLVWDWLEPVRLLVTSLRDLLKRS